MPRVWLIGGTSDSAAIARSLANAKISFTVSVATADAVALYAAGCQVRVGCLEQSEMAYFCQRQNITAVVDASHPYAVAVSSTAIAVTTKLGIPYLRYERKAYQTSTETNPYIIKLDSFDALLAGNYLQQQRALLTVGCKVLPRFKSWQKRAVLFARVLPKLASLQTALNSGFSSDRLIAMRPPFEVNLERALWQQWQISTVVTKASGRAGGEDLKRRLAADLKIPLIIITRPQIVYPQQTSSISQVVTFCPTLSS